MKHLHRDNFRFLTGHGREVAAYVDFVLGDWKIDAGSPPPNGKLFVTCDFDTGDFSYEFEDRGLCEGEPYEMEYVGGIKTTRLATLFVLVRRNGVFECIDLPLIMVLASNHALPGQYQVYQHDYVEDEGGEYLKNVCYIGITKRGWRTRWAEHVRAAESGSHYRFHQAIRQYGGAAFVAHSILACGLSEQAAMAIEEELIEKFTLYPLGLNMVPGGNAGLAYLRKIGALGARERVAPDDRQNIINRFFERASRKGLPNPLAAANWLDPSYAENVICSGPDRLKAQQIRDVRFFSSLGQDAEAIAERVGARNVDQVRRVLSGSTYSRIL